MAADMSAAASHDPEVQQLLARRWALVMDGAGNSAEAQAITDRLTALGVS